MYLTLNTRPVIDIFSNKYQKYPYLYNLRIIVKSKIEKACPKCEKENFSPDSGRK